MSKIGDFKSKKLNICLSTSGLCLSLYSIYHHLLAHLMAKTESFCNINGTFNCDAVAQSRFSEPLGIPMGVWGAGFFLAELALLALTSRPKNSPVWYQGFCILAILGAISSVVLAAISKFSVGAFCLVCIAVYAVNFAQASLILYSIQIKQILLWRSESLHVFAVAGAAEAIALSLFVPTKPWINRYLTEYRATQYLNGDASKSEQVYVPVYIRDQGTPGEDYRQGSDRAPIVIVEFGDFQCPSCALTVEPIRQVQAAFGEKILYVFKNFPLDKRCNSAIGDTVHDIACLVAELGRCAGAKGRFWDFYDVAFAKQSDTFTTQEAYQLVSDIGLDAKQVEACVGSGRPTEKIKNDIAAAQKLGVNATPALFINGINYQGPRSFEALHSFINQALHNIESNSH